MMIALADSPAATSDILQKLADSSDLQVQVSVATNPNIDRLTFEKLMAGPVRVRVAAASNTAAHQKFLEILATDPEISVRVSVASNGSISSAVSSLLAKDPAYQVRAALANNFNTPVSVLKQLEIDSDLNVCVLVDNQRLSALNKFIETLPSSKQNVAKLLFPSFTGWPDDLDVVLTNITVSKDTFVRQI